MERISSYYSLEHLVTTLDELGVPEEYICPITQDFMRDPCIAEDGHTYERAALEEWLGRHGTSPITRDYISADRLMPDATLRIMIEDFLSEKRQLLLSQREREKGQHLLSHDAPETDEHSQLPNYIASCDEDEEDDGGLEHPYVSGGARTEREPLMGFGAEARRGMVKGGQKQAKGGKHVDSYPKHQLRSPPVPPPPRRHLGTTKKGDSSPSRSLHEGPAAPSGDSRRTSCWMCVLY
jgi:hypothetical protein